MEKLNIFNRIRKIAKDRKDLDIKQQELDNELKELIYDSIIENLENYVNLKLFDLEVWYKEISIFQIGIRFKHQEMIEWEDLWDLKETILSNFNCKLSYILVNNDRELNYYFNEVSNK